MKNKFTKDADNMLEVMDRTAGRADIWQDRCIYWMAVAIFHILEWIIRKDYK